MASHEVKNGDFANLIDNLGKAETAATPDQAGWPATLDFSSPVPGQVSTCEADTLQTSEPLTGISDEELLTQALEHENPDDIAGYLVEEPQQDIELKTTADTVQAQAADQHFNGSYALELSTKIDEEAAQALSNLTEDELADQALADPGLDNDICTAE